PPIHTCSSLPWIEVTAPTRTPSPPENVLTLSPSSIATTFAKPNHIRPFGSVNSAMAVPGGPPRLSRLVQPDLSNRKVPDHMDLHSLPRGSRVMALTRGC